ncbi:hypothetical protein C2E23DRAFT_242670 [Lenzites betulinus]|nr:hypothetical protein C2E23DRAFT_242670 [Lenzites betulinus]
MESCRLPIDVCELIMDFVKEEWDGRWSLRSEREITVWMKKNYLLWQSVQIIGPLAMEAFIDAFRHAHIAITSQLRYLTFDCQHIDQPPETRLDSLRLNELFLTYKARNLRTLVLCLPYGDNRFGLPLYPRVLRARPPLLARITTLVLSNIIPSFARIVLDFMWTCPDLSSFSIHFIEPYLDYPRKRERASRDSSLHRISTSGLDKQAHRGMQEAEEP